MRKERPEDGEGIYKTVGYSVYCIECDDDVFKNTGVGRRERREVRVEARNHMKANHHHAFPYPRPLWADVDGKERGDYGEAGIEDVEER